jgi:benzodiazapine receptor
MKRRIRQIGVFLCSILLPLVIGFIGSLATRPMITTWYAALQKPFFSPPNWLFGPVWTLLYIMMGVAAYLVWRRGFERPEVKGALGLYVMQLILNCAWSLVFFGLKSPLGGLIIIVALWVLIYLMMRRFFKISQPAGWLLLPYLLWVSFATVLNLALLFLNM